MAEATTAAEQDRQDGHLVLVAPGPGTWTVDKAHVTRPASRAHQELVLPTFEAAFGRMFSRYGIPSGGYRQVVLGGFVFSQLAPVEPDDFGSRAAAAEEALATRLWRLDLERWDGEVKPASVLRLRELVGVDPDALPDGALADHVRTCADHLVAMIAQHHEFNGAAMIPLGDFLAHAMAWTDLPMSVLGELFAGASPTSTGACPELVDVRAALRDDPEAAALLRSGGDPAAVLEGLRRGSTPATAAAVDAWIDLVGHRVIDGFDVDQPYLLERPAVLVAGLRRALEDPADGPAVEARLAEVRALVPDEHREAFDGLHREARDLYRLRDERGIYSDSAAFGLLRRAMRAAGVRLHARGVVADVEDAIEAGIDELVGLLRGGAEPAGEELAARRAHRQRWTVADLPAFLGDPPGPPPPFDLLPPAMGRLTRAIVTVSGNMSSEAPGPQEADTVQGQAGSPGVHEGVARLVRSVDDLDRVEPGDVIVTVTTSESFNLALSLASAVVTDQGGLLSHAAILAREYGIPAVVGTGDATARIPDGAVVRVDGTAGAVSW
jgi:pyruvate,water dikinase